MPDTWARHCRIVIGCDTSGTWSPSRSSSESRPSSRSCITITAVKVLVLDAMRNWSSAVGRALGADVGGADAVAPDQLAAAADAGVQAGHAAVALLAEGGAAQDPGRGVQQRLQS